MSADNDTICAIATPPGAGGVGIVRVSGPAAADIATEVIGRLPEPRRATHAGFRDADGSTIDDGLALWFPGPRSFTGEDVLELQGHGGPVVLQMLLDRLRALGARDARPGEFSERAFLNGRIDLAQAEAIADLIDSGSAAAARAAHRSMTGAFSDRVKALQEQLTALRVFVEAALDFPDEEIDFLAESDVAERIEALARECASVRAAAHQGQLLRDGVTLAIIGQPNAGKSSLLNALAGRDAAIVTDIPGTTRDVLRAYLSLGGLPVHVVDTAGIRETTDRVEAEGVRRAREALRGCDLALLVIDPTEPLAPQLALAQEVPEAIPVVHVVNKIDRTPDRPVRLQVDRSVELSALHGTGLDRLANEVRDVIGASAADAGAFSARQRHVDALRRAEQHLHAGISQFTALPGGETLAEELRLAQEALGEITGRMIADDLLGEIFAGFCIGK